MVLFSISVKHSTKCHIRGYCESSAIMEMVGTVFGQLLFLIFINDITNNTSSTARLFEEDCVLYRTINCKADAITLQKNLR